MSIIPLKIPFAPTLIQIIILSLSKKAIIVRIFRYSPEKSFLI